MAVAVESQAIENRTNKHVPYRFSSNTAAVNAFRQAELLDKSGQHEAAVTELSRALHIDPHFDEARQLRGWLYLKQTYEPTKALEDHNFLIAEHPKEFNWYYRRAQVHGVLRQFKEAIADYDQALRLEPQCLNAYCQRAEIWEALGQWQKACDDYT
ncbi:MAG: tetratricopeptide repeat protein, partial [Terriglobales bacterium]